MNFLKKLFGPSPQDIRDENLAKAESLPQFKIEK